MMSTQAKHGEQAKRLKLNGPSFPDELLTSTLQFAIDSLKTWCVFKTVSSQFKRCANKPWVLSHLKLELTGAEQLSLLRTTGICPQNLALTFPATQTLLRFDALRSLSLDDVTDADLEEVAKLTSIRSLSITNAKITDFGLSKLTTLPLLTNLRVANSTRITDSGLGTLAILTSLGVLKLHDCPLVTGQGLSVLASLPIKCLELVNCSFIGNKDLQTIAGMRELSSLTLGPCVHVDVRGLRHITRLPSLDKLDLRGCLLTNDWLLPVSAITTLKNLRLHTVPGSRVTTLGLKALQPLIQLESLEWRFELGDQALQALRPLVALRSIKLGADLTDGGLRHLSNMTGLTSVTLSCMPAVTDKGLSSLYLLSSLEELILEDLYITGEGLLGLGELPSFHKLSFNGCKNVTDAGLSSLSSMPYLQTLDVVGARIKNPNFLYFPVMSRLNLSNCRYLLDISLAQLPTAAPKLTALDVSGCQLLSDAGLRVLAPVLTDLKLSSCTQITDGCFATPCLGLRTLDVAGCSGLEGRFLHERYLPNIEDLCLSNCDGLNQLASLHSLIKTLKALDVSFCDYVTNDIMDALQPIPCLLDGGCLGLSDDETAQKVDQVRADSPNAATNLLIEALSNSPRPNTRDFFSVVPNDSTISLLQNDRQVLAIAWADIDWKHVSWHFGHRRPQWAFFLMDNTWIQAHARTS
jgi:hypothetical protein